MSRIEDYALIGDLHTAAMVGVYGSIDWLCLPRFDSPACFAALVGTRENGHWRIAPLGAGQCTNRAYRRDSLILETLWETPSGTVRVTDAMPPRRDTTSAVRVVRVVEGLSGSVQMAMDLVLRFGYGAVVPWVRRLDSGALEAIAGPDAVWLRTPVTTHGRDRSTVAEFTVRAGDDVPFVLTYGPSCLAQPTEVDAVEALHDAQSFWDDWAAQTAVEGPLAPDVSASLVVLKALTYAPTGAVAAAVTTSLPEEIGGSRNWDYRYCWLRDATFTLQALLDSGHTSEALAWRDWLLRAVAGDPSQLQVMYAVDGARELPERELTWLTGFSHSRPVRVGNAASDQLQLDVWGEVLDSMHLSRLHGVPLRHTHGSSRSHSSTTSKAPGASPTTASGRDADLDDSSSTPRSWPGSAWTERSRPSRSSASPAPSTAGGASGRTSTTRSAGRASTPDAARSRSSTAPRVLTPRC